MCATKTLATASPTFTAKKGATKKVLGTFLAGAWPFVAGIERRSGPGGSRGCARLVGLVGGLEATLDALNVLFEIDDASFETNRVVLRRHVRAQRGKAVAHLFEARQAARTSFRPS
jgi:hypothetical protein